MEAVAFVWHLRKRGEVRPTSASRGFVWHLRATGLLMVGWFGFGCAPAPAPGPASFVGEVMGTTYSVKLGTPATEAELEAARDAVDQAFRAVDDAMTTYRASEVTRFNDTPSTEPQPMSPPTLDVLSIALDVSARTGGAFDVTVAPLVAAWGFGSAAHRGDPDPTTLETAREVVGDAHLSIDREAGTAEKALPGLQIDLSGVAKGYAVDRAAAALEALGFVWHLIELGGEVRAGGRRPDGAAWTLGIERPDAARGVVQRVVPLRDLAMATSGDYRNYREVEGRRISHVLDPRTGGPATHRTASTTVLHDECAVADAVATAMLVLGSEEGLEVARVEGWAVLFLDRTDDGFVERTSESFDRLLESAELPLPVETER